MKLNPNFITQDIGDVQYLVSGGMDGFNGIVKSNSSAAFIVDCLKDETTKEEIVKAVEDKYDASHEVIEKDVDKILEKLRSIGALQE